MINAVLIDGVQVNNQYTFLSSVKDSVAAQIDLADYARGGRSGVALGKPFYRGFVISLEWTVIGNTYAKLLEQRDRLARFFRLKPDKTSSQFKTLSFVMVDGSIRQIEVVFSPYIGSISAENTTKTTIQVTAHTEREYFVSNDEFTSTVTVLNRGGFSVPFDVPFSLSNNPSGEETVINNLGNAEYYPTVTLTAPLTRPILINDTTGQQIEYTGDLETTDYLELDFYERTALLNGTTNALASINGDWWYLEPGNNNVRLSSSGTGAAEIVWRYAYRGI